MSEGLLTYCKSSLGIGPPSRFHFQIYDSTIGRYGPLRTPPYFIDIALVSYLEFME